MLPHVVMHFIAVQFAGDTVGIQPFADFFMQAEGMIALDTFIGAHAGHYRFAAAAESGHQMIDDAAGEDDLVRFGYAPVDDDRRSAGGRAKLNQVGLVMGIVLVYLDPVAGFGAANGDVFRRCMGPVRTQRHYDRDIGVRYAGGIELIQQRR